jgi:hypothetical protein
LAPLTATAPMYSLAEHVVHAREQLHDERIEVAIHADAQIG